MGEVGGLVFFSGCWFIFCLQKSHKDKDRDSRVTRFLASTLLLSSYGLFKCAQYSTWKLRVGIHLEGVYMFRNCFVGGGGVKFVWEFLGRTLCRIMTSSPRCNLFNLTHHVTKRVAKRVVIIYSYQNIFLFFFWRRGEGVRRKLKQHMKQISSFNTTQIIVLITYSRPEVCTNCKIFATLKL